MIPHPCFVLFVAMVLVSPAAVAQESNDLLLTRYFLLKEETRLVPQNLQDLAESLDRIGRLADNADLSALASTEFIFEGYGITFYRVRMVGSSIHTDKSEFAGIGHDGSLVLGEEPDKVIGDIVDELTTIAESDFRSLVDLYDILRFDNSVRFVAAFDSVMFASMLDFERFNEIRTSKDGEMCMTKMYESTSCLENAKEAYVITYCLDQCGFSVEAALRYRLPYKN